MSLSVIQAAFGKTASAAQREQAQRLSEGGHIVLTNDDPLLVIALAAATAIDSIETELHIATRTMEEATQLTAAFALLENKERILCAPTETLIFDYLKGNRTTRAFALLMDAESTLLNDANTPVILAHSPTGEADIPPAVQEEADQTLLRGRDYEVIAGEIVVRDPVNGTLLPGRRFTGGLHAAIQKREGIPGTKEGEVIAQITIGEYFRGYQTLAGIATKPAEEFSTLYQLTVG